MLETMMLLALYLALCYSIPVLLLLLMNQEQPSQKSREAVAIDPELRSSKRHAWFGQENFMYNLKHYTLTVLYYISIVIRGLLLIVLKPLNFIVELVYSMVSDWDPSKPLHKSKDIDYDDPDNYGI